MARKWVPLDDKKYELAKHRGYRFIKISNGGGKLQILYGERSMGVLLSSNVRLCAQVEDTSAYDALVDSLGIMAEALGLLNDVFRVLPLDISRKYDFAQRRTELDSKLRAFAEHSGEEEGGVA